MIERGVLEVEEKAVTVFLPSHHCGSRVTDRWTNAKLWEKGIAPLLR